MKRWIRSTEQKKKLVINDLSRDEIGGDWSMVLLGFMLCSLRA